MDGSGERALEVEALGEATVLPLEVGAEEGAPEGNALEEGAPESKLVPGQKVRLAVEDLVYKLRFGEKATVEKVMGPTTKVLFEKALAPTEVPTEFLEPGPWTMSKPLRTFARVSQREKRLLLLSLGVDGSGESTLEELPKKGDGIFDESIDVYGTMVSCSFPDEVGFKYVPLSLSRCPL